MRCFFLGFHLGNLAANFRPSLLGNIDVPSVRDAYGRRKNRHLYFGEQPANDEILAGSFFLYQVA